MRRCLWLPAFGIDGSRSPIGYGVMARLPMRRIQNVSVALYCAAILLRAFFFKVQSRGQDRERERVSCPTLFYRPMMA